MRVLLVEDDNQMAAYITRGLGQEGFVVDHAADGDAGYDWATAGTYDVLIVDVMMPGRSGVTLVGQLRQENLQTPILFLSARDTVEDRVLGLESGGDDYLVKPFAFSELVARLHALVRRTSDIAVMTVLQVGEVSMDLRKRKVTVENQGIVLQPRELLMLEYLMRNEGKVVSKTMIMEHVWDYNFDPQTNVVEAKISRLRTKLAKFSSQPIIHTVKGLGYLCECRA